MICRSLKIRHARNETLTEILGLLPGKYTEAYLGLTDRQKEGLTEIRIRSGHPCSFTSDGKNIVMTNEKGKTVCSDEEELSAVIAEACNGSVYSVQGCINDGYIPFCGTRIGVCGTGTVIDGRYGGQRNITSLVFRIPSYSASAADKMFDYIEENGFESTMGILAVSPPNCGKTTFLRALAARISDIRLGDKAKRVCIIDERGELYNKNMMENCMCDVVSGMPKIRALEMAVRTLSPQVVIFDEIGSEEQTGLLCKAYSGGVYIAASVHGKSLEDVTYSEGIRKAIKKGVFSTAYLMDEHTPFGNGTIIDARKAEQI